MIPKSYATSYICTCTQINIWLKYRVSYVLHYDFKLKLKIGKEEEIILYRCGVRQVDNLAGTIFIMAMEINALKIEKNQQK